MLIIEGPDMLGKTTFARKLVDALSGSANQPFIDKFGLPEASYTELSQWTDRYAPNKICDRYIISEPIYGLICRGETKTSIQAFQEIWWRLSELGGAHVLLYVTHPSCYRDLILPQRFDEVREAFTREQCQEVALAYWTLGSGGLWRGYRIPAIHNIKIKTVEVQCAGMTIEQPDRDAGKFAADWVRHADERQIVNHLWRSK